DTLEVDELEPTSSSVPQQLGVLDGGALLTGSLASTTPSGLDPADRDGYAFTLDAEGPLTITLEQLSGSGSPPFTLALVEGEIGSSVQRAAILGEAPLTLSVAKVPADTNLRLLVGAFHDGEALDYGIEITPQASLPTWSGALCDPATEVSEPNDDLLAATDLGDFTGILCAGGSLDAVHPPAAEDESDRDVFIFRNVLPVPARLTVDADPGTTVVTVQQLVFIGVVPVASSRFGERSVLELPALEPGQQYGIEVTAEIGQAPLNYSFRLEPVAPPPPEPPAPLDILKADLRLDGSGQRGAFKIVAEFETQDLGSLFPGETLAWTIRGLEEGPIAGALQVDARGRYVYRAPRGSRGLRRLVMDPETGIAKLKGRRADLRGDVADEDPAINVLLSLGEKRLAGEVEGERSPSGRRLRFRAK
ncbi:MAG: hypothetical protein ACYTDX_00910, partial [Planctomycetota bacterium]